jgi:hypothetical protein
MEKVTQYILKLRDKPENIRKEILAGVLTVCMVIVGGVWAYSLGSRFSDGKVSVQVKEDVKPLSLISTQIKDTYKGLVASVGKSEAIIKPQVQEEKKIVTPDKVINLIPIEQ